MAETSTKRSLLQEKINWYLTWLLLFLLLVMPPILCGLFYLSQVPDLSWERDDHLTYDRIWMYRERRPLGIGYQAQRVVEEYSDTEVCVQTDLQFFLWGQSKKAETAMNRRIMVFVNNRWQPGGRECY